MNSLPSRIVTKVVLRLSVTLSSVLAESYWPKISIRKWKINCRFAKLFLFFPPSWLRLFLPLYTAAKVASCVVSQDKEHNRVIPSPSTLSVLRDASVDTTRRKKTILTSVFFIFFLFWNAIISTQSEIKWWRWNLFVYVCWCS